MHQKCHKQPNNLNSASSTQGKKKKYENEEKIATQTDISGTLSTPKEPRLSNLRTTHTQIILGKGAM